MEAAVITKDQRVEIVNRPRRALEYGEARLAMECCGVCHTDLHIKNGEFGDRTGVVLGHEGVGIVTEIGPGVTALKPGDRASVAWFYQGCGHCEYCNANETFCRTARNSGCNVDGGMAHECIVVANYAVKVPEGLDFVAASSITCAGVTVYKALKVSGVKPGQWVAIYGLGGLGNLAIQYAKNVFNAKVIAIDVVEEQLALARELGMDLMINPRGGEDAAKVIQEKTGGAHAAVVTAVAKSAFDSAVHAVRAGGRIVAIGLPPESMTIDIPHLVLNGIQIVGSLVGTRQDLAEAFQFAAEGKVIPKVTMRPLKDINDIFEEMHQGKIRGRMVVDLRH